ncbi:MAG: RNA polymerase sigma factor [Paludibacteraceae bacterium]
MSKSDSFYNNDEDNSLFLLIKKRDREAFTIVYNKYHQYLYVIAVRYLKNSEMAEEVVQHVFVKLWETVKDIDIQVNMKNYLFTMTKNHILNIFRSKQEIISLSYEKAQIEITDETGDFLQMLEEKQLLSLLNDGIETLSPQKKEICWKKINENKSNQEIADEMGISVNTVKSHYQESIKLLRVFFKNIEKKI